MARFSEEWLARLLDKNDIADVIGEYVHLERKGTRLWAACPWHAGKEPFILCNPGKADVLLLFPQKGRRRN